MVALGNNLVRLDPVTPDTVEMVIAWVLDPIAQGVYQRVPERTPDNLRHLILHDPTREYFVIRDAASNAPLGRFYWRAWHFHDDPDLVDWELMTIIAKPNDRRKGYGTEANRLAAAHLLTLAATHSVFAHAAHGNTAAQRALLKCGFVRVGALPHAYYALQPDLPSDVFMRKSL